MSKTFRSGNLYPKMIQNCNQTARLKHLPRPWLQNCPEMIPKLSVYLTPHEDFELQASFNNPFKVLGLQGLFEQPLPRFGTLQVSFSNPFRGGPLNLIGSRRGPGRASLMKFSSTNPIGGKIRTFFSTNPFGGKKVSADLHTSPLR